MPRAVLSVYDKTGVVEFAKGLVRFGWDIVSTGGTARALREAGMDVVDVSEVTGHPEMMDGRIKTLHPAIHAGILARRDHAEDMAALEEQGYAPVDLVAVNLYPFAQTVQRSVPPEEAIEQIDVGGPALLRAAAKNHAGVLAVVDPQDYSRVLNALEFEAVDDALRLSLAQKVFTHTSYYDQAIAKYFAERKYRAGSSTTMEVGEDEEGRFAKTVTLELRKVQDLRYGENPDQAAAFYSEGEARSGSLAKMKKLHGKELSYNNLLDVDAAVFTVSAWSAKERAACAIIKHTTPCGVALGKDAEEAYRRALETDPVSAFGGAVAFNVPVNTGAGAAMTTTFLEVVVAPGFSPQSLAALETKKNLRLIILPIGAEEANELDYKHVRGGMLVQDRMRPVYPEDAWRVVTQREPTPDEWRDLRFAWRVCAAVKSNAIVIARAEQTLGIGAGQMSRVDSSRLAIMKAGDRSFDLKGTCVASDAFFPFRDGVDALAPAGIAAIIQPGGSVRDQEVIDAANEHGVAMVFTGRRVFRH